MLRNQAPDILHIKHNVNSRRFLPKQGYCLGLILPVGVTEWMAGIWQVGVKRVQTVVEEMVGEMDARVST